MKPPAYVLAGALVLLAAPPVVAEMAGAAVSVTPAIDVTAEGITKTVAFENWKVRLATPGKVGTISRGIFCSGSSAFAFTTTYGEFFVFHLAKIFAAKSIALGYPKYETARPALASAPDPGADFRIGFTLLDMRQNLCIDGGKASGTGRFKLRAELYSTRLRKVVYSRDIDSTFSSGSKIKLDAFVDSMIDNVLNVMFADQQYVNNFRENGVTRAAARAVRTANRLDRRTGPVNGNGPALGGLAIAAARSRDGTALP